MITYNGQTYHEPLDIRKRLPYFRIDLEKGIAAILPYSALKYPDFKEHKISLKTFLERQIALTPIIINSYASNSLEVSKTVTGGRRLMLPTYLTEGFNGPGEMYDHINHDRTDDTDSNLRIANRAQNSYNKQLAKNNTSGYKGVTKASSSYDTWAAGIWCDGKHYAGKTYHNKIVAGLAYNELAKEHHKEFAGLNLITADMLQELTKDPTVLKSLIKDLAKLDNCFGTNWSKAIAN